MAAPWDGLLAGIKKIMNRDVFEDRDRFFLCIFASLGSEKNQSFQPKAAQAEVLKEAAVIGEAMFKSITFDKPFSNNAPYKGTNWDQLYRRSAFT